MAVAARLARALTSRQPDPGFYQDDDGYVPFWYTRTGVIVKWCIFLGFLLLLGGYVFGGYWHARRRISRGLPPLAYHRWLVSRGQMARVDPRYVYPQPAAYPNYRPQGQNDYGMYAMPPPVYDPTAPRPPGYDQAPPNPPQQEGGPKIDPNQHRGEASTSVEESYAPPPGPPPSALRAQETGSSNNPYRV